MIERVLLSLDSATLTNVEKFNKGGAQSLPVRVSNGTPKDLTIVKQLSGHFFTAFDPDGVHVWVGENGRLRQHRISDGVQVNSYTGLGAVQFPFIKIGSDFYVRCITTSNPIVKGTFNGATPTVANIGTFKPGGDVSPPGGPAPVAGNKAWFVTDNGTDDLLIECDLGGATDPAPALRSIATPFNPKLDLTGSYIVADSTHLYLWNYYEVHRWRLSDLRYEGHSRPHLTSWSGAEQIRGLYVPDDGTVKIVRGGSGITPSVDIWTPIEQSTATVFNGTGLPVAIPDASNVDIDIVVTGLGTIDGLAVTVETPDHTYIGDLEIKLTHPDGSTFVMLWDNAGSSLDGLNVELCDVSDIFRGLAANGTWKLNVRDTAGGDTGNITVAKLYFGAGGKVKDAETRNADEAGINFQVPFYEPNADGNLEGWVRGTTLDARVTGAEPSATAGSAEWSYAVPSARIFRGAILIGDLGRESTPSAAARKTRLYYDVGVTKTGWTEIRPGEDPAIDVAVGESVFIKADLDPLAGDQPWISEVALLLDDRGNRGFEGVATLTVIPEATVTI